MTEARGLVLLGLVVAGFWVPWYPPAIAIEDEAAYLAQARIFARGELVGNEPGDRTISMRETARGVAAKYPPGHPLLLAPFQWGPWRLGFLLPVTTLLLTTLLAALALRRNGHSALWAALVLLHPTLLLYSRTLMSELTAALVVTAGFIWSDPRRPRPIAAGLALGAAPAMRTALLPIAGFLGALFVWRLWRDGKRIHAAQAVGAALVPLLALAAYNFAVFGNPVELHAQYTGTFDWGSSPSRFLFYAVALNLLWPLLAVGVALSRHPRRLEAQVILAFTFLLYGAYYFVDRRFGFPADLVVGLRFFAPVLPLLCIIYVEPLDRLLRHARHRNALAIVGILAVIAANIALVSRHHGFLSETALRRDVAVAAAQQADFVAVHGSAAELMSPAWGAPPFVLAGSVDEVLQRAERAALDGAAAVAIAQGVAADSLARLSTHPLLTAPGLTVIQVAPSTANR